MTLLILLLLRVLWVYSYLFLAYAVLSWIPALYDSWIARWIAFLVEPVLAPLRRFPLQIGGLDFTVLVAMLLTELLSNLLYAVLV